MTEDIYSTVAAAHNDARQRGVLNIWTIYRHPTEFPHSYVAIRFEIGDKGQGDTLATDDIVQGELRIIRESFKHCGLACLPRSPEDDPKILESWL